MGCVRARVKMTSIDKIWAVLSILLLSACHCKVVPKKRVCVIGAGRAGLAAIKVAADRSDHLQVIAVERNSDVGGLWIYRDDPYVDEHNLTAHSGIYKHLRTNLPINFMAYPDYPYDVGNNTAADSEDELERLLLVPHQVFLEYMRNYTEHFQLRKYIQFDTLVTKVSAVQANTNWTRWRMETRNLKTNRTHFTDCEAVMLANGHYSKPYIPNIPGLESFGGKVLHSRSYRIPEEFVNRSVVILGAGNSGTDIANDISAYAKTVYLSHRHASDLFGQQFPSNVRDVRGVVAVNGNRFILQDNSSVTADSIIFCTGYEYDFPFLHQSSGITFDRKHVRPLYQQLINVQHPTMAFIGFSIDFNYAELYHGQTTAFLDIFQGKQTLPSYEQMLDNSKEYDDFVG